MSMTRTYLLDVAVVPVLLALDRYPDRRGRYWCLAHDDQRPGGHPSAEVRSDPCVLECWSCGRRMMAGEIVARITGCSVLEGTERALSIAGEHRWDRAGAPRLEGPSPARLEAELARQTVGVRYPRDIDPVEFFCKERGWSSSIMRYAKDAWGWAGDYRGRVVIPHRSRKGALTGIKWRIPPTWKKSGRPGSSYRQLYGSWRVGVAGAREIWICEGEPDTVFAAAYLEPLGVAVLGATTALYRPREDELALMRGKTVVLVLDRDSAGGRGQDRWRAALRGVADQLQVIELPADTDLCQIGVSVPRLRERVLA